MASIKRVGKDSFGVPIWEAVYRRTPGGKQVRRRFHAAAKSDVEREILLDSQRSGIGLRWSEGVRIYVDAKLSEGCKPFTMTHVERAKSAFIKIAGDIAIEKTTPAIMKDFMQRVTSGKKVANEHRRRLLAAARYLLKHTGKIFEIPFRDVPSLPVKVMPRSPIPDDRVMKYLDALPPYIRRPIEMVLYYGLRSTAICNLTLASIDGPCLVALDKNDVVRRIPIDDMLAKITGDAKAYRETFPNPAKSLFLNFRGQAWNHTTLLRAAQRAWTAAGLEKKKVHEVRHTLGTLAGRSFTPGMVQAAMGHRSRRSAEVYFHPTEEMAAEVRRKIITDISRNVAQTSPNNTNEHAVTYMKNGRYTCPCCGCKLLISKE